MSVRVLSERLMTQAVVAVTYARVSSQQQVDGVSLEIQQDRTRQKVAELGGTIYAEYREEGVTGSSNIRRPELQKALADIEAGRANTLVVMSQDRLARWVVGLQEIFARVAKAGGRIVFADGTTCAMTAAGKLQRQVKGVVDEYERERIRERCMEATYEIAASGRMPKRAKAPFGYRIVTKAHVIRGEYAAADLGKYYVIEEQARIVSEMFRRYAQGQSLLAIARWLNSANVRAPKGGTCWRESTVRTILTNPVYKGTAVFARQHIYVDEGRIGQVSKMDPSKRLKGVVVSIRPEEEWITIPCDETISPELWEQVQAEMKVRVSKRSGNPYRIHMLSGLLRCPACGGSCNGARRNRPNGGYYRCGKAYPTRHTDKPRECDSRVSYSSCDYEAAVIDHLTALARQPELFAAAINAYNRRMGAQEATETRESLRNQIERCKKKENTTVDAQIAALMAGRDSSRYEAIIAETVQERQRLEASLREMEAAGANPLPLSNVEKWTAALEALEFALAAPELNGAEKRDLLLTVVDRIVPQADGNGAVDMWLKLEGEAKPYTLASCSMTSTASWR